ncbi:MAG: ChbG/HpnK family deacetylase [Alphaproteobacteria bacterium]|nr:ChbG/HpnK family deacetylase [Alphaproteobacteria bacterium]
MALKKIFNADDFGISKGVNAAIEQAHKEGILNSTSLMINQKYADEAIEKAKQMPDLEVGLHINLTNENPAANPQDIPLLVNKDGKFKNGFVNLLIMSFLHPRELKRQAEIEIRAQIEKYLQSGLKLEHLDSHRHIHLIPVIFKVAEKLGREFKVKRIRIMNENIFNTIRQNRSKSYLFDGGIVKYMLLRFLSWWNGYKSDIYFYTILYTCKISSEQFENVKIPHGYKAVEIMIHPGRPDIDKQYLQDVWDGNILSPWRKVELQTLLNKENYKGISGDD